MRVVIAAAVALSLMPGFAEATDMKSMDHSAMTKSDKIPKTHKAVGVVRKVDAQSNSVTLAHEAVKSLNWPAMTMSFKVQDKAILDKLAQGRKVEVDFEQRGKDYFITKVN